MLKKKSLGQNFLHTAHYVRAVADAGEVAAGDTVLEVGPGDGALTSELLARGAIVLAIEKDHRLIPLLQEKFKDAIVREQLYLVEGDALELLPGRLGLRSGEFKVVANIPYNITGALLRALLSGDTQPNVLVFLIQKEVAQRVVAKSSSSKARPQESILSLSVKAYGTPTYVKTVPRGAFNPPPNVDSAILRVANISRKNFSSTQHEQQFFNLIKAGFAQKRKLLRRNIERVLGAETLALLHKASIAETARAENVPLEKWLTLAEQKQTQPDSPSISN